MLFLPKFPRTFPGDAEPWCLWCQTPCLALSARDTTLTSVLPFSLAFFHSEEMLISSHVLTGFFWWVPCLERSVVSPEVVCGHITCLYFVLHQLESAMFCSLWIGDLFTPTHFLRLRLAACTVTWGTQGRAKKQELACLLLGSRVCAMLFSGMSKMSYFLAMVWAVKS